MDIGAKLKEFNSQSEAESQAIYEFSHESAFVRTKKDILKALANSEAYRLSILKNVSTFSHLSPATLVTAAQFMEELHFVKGDAIIQQDDIGDAFYVVEEGLVSVMRKQNSRDNSEPWKEVAQLTRNAHFGEISLLTEELRSATVVVISNTCKTLRMTKTKFEELMASSQKIKSTSQAIIGRDVLDSVHIFNGLMAMHKAKLLEAMTPANFMPKTHICRQGSTGNTFYIIIEGSCRVTLNTDNGGEIEVAKLYPGDFFGEVALLEVSNKRTANVISIDTVNCLSLSRADFNRLLKNLKVKLMEHQAMRNLHSGAVKSKDKKSLELAKNRRISGYNIYGQRDEPRISNLFKCFSKYMTEALFCSIYSRMYRQMLLDVPKAMVYGNGALNIMSSNCCRTTAVEAIRKEAIRVLEMEPSKRVTADHCFVIGLLQQRNQMREKLCHGWPTFEFANLCRKFRMVRAKAMKKIIEFDTRGSSAFLILRGAVRVFSKITHASGVSKMLYEEDLVPGDIFGEIALQGTHTRIITAQAITEVDLLTIEDNEFSGSQDRKSVNMNVEGRFQYLSQVPLFKGWETYKLYRLAHQLVQEEIPKGSVLMHHGVDSKAIMFILQGQVDIVTSLHHPRVITTMQRCDYLGESGFINSRVKKSSHKVTEELYAVGKTKVDVLILTENHFDTLDRAAAELILSAFHAKQMWRRERTMCMHQDRGRVRKLKKELQMMSLRPPAEENADERSVRHTTTSGVVTATTNTTSSNNAANINMTRPSTPVCVFGESDAAAAVRAGSSAAVINSHLSSSATVATLSDPLLPAIVTNSMNFPCLSDMEDIPVILNQDYDPFMITTTIPFPRKLLKVQEKISDLRRPKSARLLLKNAKAEEDLGFSNIAGSLGLPHPEATQPARPKTASDLDKIKDSLRYVEPRTCGSPGRPTSGKANDSPQQAALNVARKSSMASATSLSSALLRKAPPALDCTRDDEASHFDDYDDDNEDDMGDVDDIQRRYLPGWGTRLMYGGGSRIPSSKSYCDILPPKLRLSSSFTPNSNPSIPTNTKHGSQVSITTSKPVEKKISVLMNPKTPKSIAGNSLKKF